jgi:hypothetical protein
MKSYSELAVHNREWISVGGFHNKVKSLMFYSYSLNTAYLNVINSFA